jgi:general secretion pathway protein C
MKLAALGAFGRRREALVRVPFALASHGPDVAAVILAALLATELAILVWQFLPGVRHRAPAPAALPGALPAASALDIETLINAHIFQVAPAAQGPVAVSQAPLVLTGTLAGPDPAQGWAIIGENPAQAHLYATGALLPGGIRLNSVYPDHVLLDRAGQLESLALPQRSGGSAAPARAGARGSAPLSESVSRLIAQDPGIVGQVLRPQPVFANGALRGFRLYPGTDRAKFQRLGLEAGDLVTHVNGVPLADAQHGMEILKNLGGAQSAEVTIERGGQAQTLTVDTQKLAALEPEAAPGAAPAAAPPATPPTR